MDDEKKTTDAQSPDEYTRRESFAKLGLGSLAIIGGGATVFGYEFLSPNVLYEPSPVVNAGKPGQYPQGSVTADPKTGIYIVHEAQGFFALSAICTHLGCLTAWTPELGIIACPCHGSKFRTDGTKIEGPAPRPLPWLRVTLSDEGDLMVDRSATVAAGQFLRT
jgi:cytochrome b6-f complex iron-sulfur subunit